MASNDRLNKLREQNAPPAVMIIGIILLVLAIGSGAFFVYNGGWKTSAQQDEDYKHNMLPIMAAKKGDMEPFEAENKLRKEHGQPLLVLPADKEKTAGKARQSLGDLQKQLGATPENASPGQ